MKPLPNLQDVQAMAERGRRSSLMQSRKEAHELLRDAAVSSQSASWEDLIAHADVAATAAERLKTLSAMWNEIETKAA